VVDHKFRPPNEKHQHDSSFSQTDKFHTNSNMARTKTLDVPTHGRYCNYPPNKCKFNCRSRMRPGYVPKCFSSSKARRHALTHERLHRSLNAFRHNIQQGTMDTKKANQVFVQLMQLTGVRNHGVAVRATKEDRVKQQSVKSDIFKVEDVHGVRVHKVRGVKVFKVLFGWEGYDERTWEPVKSFVDSPRVTDMVIQYLCNLDPVISTARTLLQLKQNTM
jgi:hypothetical protein